MTRFLFALYLLGSLVAILVFTFWFQYPLQIILGHTLFAAAGHATFLWFSHIAFHRLLLRRNFFAVYHALYTFVWSLFYLLIFISNANWGDTISLVIVKTYTRDLPPLLQAMNLQPWKLFAGFFMLAALLFLIHYLLFPIRKLKAAPAFRRLFLPLNRRGFSRMAAAGLVAFCIAAGIYKTKIHFNLLGEPLSKFAFGYVWMVEQPGLYDPNLVRIRQEDDRERSAYRKIPPARNGKNVILIVVDALRADHLGCYGYERQTSPFLDSLVKAQKALRVEHAFAASNGTVSGIASLFLSRHWRDISPRGFSLAEVLKMQGYTCYGILSGYHEGWYSLGSVYRSSLDRLYDGADMAGKSLSDDLGLIPVLKNLPVKNNRPHFFYIHLMSTHDIGFLHDPYRRYRPDDGNFFAAATGENRQKLVNNYDNRVVQTDDVIRRILSELKKKQHLDNSLVIITSDHGQSLGEGGRLGHINYIDREAVNIPLIIIDDSLSLYQNTYVARQLDIAPTIIDRLSLPVPRTWQGHSLLKPQEPVISYHENATVRKGKLFSIIQSDATGIYRYIFNKGYGREELYRVVSPKEDVRITNKAQLDYFHRLSLQVVDSVFSTE